MELQDTIKEILSGQTEKAEAIEVIEKETIPSEQDMSLEVGRWYRIRNVVSCYIDMKGSTELTNDRYINISAQMHEMFTGCLIKIFKLEEFQSHFIDIKGDGGFALWKERYGAIKALLAAVTFKTLVEDHLKEIVKNKISGWDISSKIGISKGKVLVKKIGQRNVKDRQYNWAVWVGKPINVSSKLSDIANADSILITNDIYTDLSQPPSLERYLKYSCGCDGEGNRVGSKVLWKEKEELNSEFNSKIWLLKSKWCRIHGEDTINNVLDVIND